MQLSGTPLGCKRCQRDFTHKSGLDPIDEIPSKEKQLSEIMVQPKTEEQIPSMSKEIPDSKNKFCPYCGSKLNSQFQFCPSCGRKVGLTT